MRKSVTLPLWTVLGLVAITFLTGTAVAVGLGFQATVNADYGQVTYAPSDLDIVDYEATGPGINTDAVNVTVENTGTASVDGNVAVFLTSNGTEVAKGETTGTWSAGQNRTVSVDVPRTVEHAYDTVDIKVKEV